MPSHYEAVSAAPNCYVRQEPQGQVMANNRYAQKQAYEMVPVTCPKVDIALSKAMDVAAEEIKQQTSALRDALVSAIERAEDAEGEVKERDLEIDSLSQRISELEHALAEAEAAAAAEAEAEAEAST